MLDESVAFVKDILADPSAFRERTKRCINH
jgi:hypothetical protein